MAAPPDQIRSSMALSFMQAGPQDDRQLLEDQDVDGHGADLDSAVAVQLIAKTARLSISGLRSETVEFPVLDDRPRAQTWDATTGEWREAASAENSAPACGILSSAFNFSTMEIPSTSRLSGEELDADGMGLFTSQRGSPTQLLDLPNEVLFQILGYLEVCDLLATSRTSHRLRTLSLTPYLHHTRLRRTRALLPPLLTSPSRPSLADLIRRSIVLTHTTFASRRLARNLASIRLARQLASRPSAETLVERCVLPPECLPCSASKKKNGGGGGAVVAPALVARKRAVERERVKDRLREWIGNVWKGEVVKREEGVRRWEERAGVGRVWRLRRYWERVARGEV